MSLECGMEHINDMWDWSPKRDRRNPSNTSGARPAPEEPEPRKPNTNLVPEFVKELTIKTAVWLSQNPHPDHISEPEAKSIIARGMLYLTEADTRRSAMISPQIVIASGRNIQTKEALTIPLPTRRISTTRELVASL